MKVELRVSTGPHEGQTFRFDRHAAFSVGRASDAQCSMPEDPFLSRHHFLVEVNPPLCLVRDLGSTNGIRVNGVRVECTRLQDGDTIAAGNSAFRVVIESSGVLPIVCRGCATPAPPDLTISAMPGEVVEWYCRACADRRRRYPKPPKGYWIERYIGGGGMGEVFLARREADNLPVALKVMIPVVAAGDRIRAYFLREMNVMRNLRHRNIVAFFEAIEDEGQFQLLMEFIDGKGAREWVDALPGPPPVQAIASIGKQLLLALDHAHQRGFVHRDIKPSNVLVMGGVRRPLVKLSDFGLAKNFRDEAGFNGMTIEGDFGGSMGFLSPDHIRGFRDVKGAADIYSAGATLYYLLSGRYPFLDFDPKNADAINKTLEHPAVPLRVHRRDVPEAFDRIIRRSLEKNPSDRWPTAKDMADALSPFAADPLMKSSNAPGSSSAAESG
jgi:serine/threonine-protein kinase